MIKARDWIPFLSAGVPLESLPVPEEHMEYCKGWLKKHSFPENILKEIQQVLQDYQPATFERKEIHKNEQGHTATPIIEVSHLKSVRITQKRKRSQKRYPVTFFVDIGTFEKIENTRGYVERSCFLARIIEEELTEKGC